MSKLKECVHCGEWAERIGLNGMCACCIGSLTNHYRLRERFFGDTMDMIEDLFEENLFEPMPIAFAIRRAKC